LCIDHTPAVVRDTGSVYWLAAHVTGRAAAQQSIEMFLETRADEV